MKVIFVCLIFILQLFLLTTTAQTKKTKRDSTKRVIPNPHAMPIKDTNIYVFFPNTKIKIKPPLHFMEYPKIQGFIHPGSSTTIQANEINGTPYVMYTKGLTPEYFQTQGVKFISEENVITIGNHTGKLYIVSFTSDGVDFERIMFFTGDYNRTVWLNANYPVMIKFLLFETLKRSLLSVEF